MPAPASADPQQPASAAPASKGTARLGAAALLMTGSVLLSRVLGYGKEAFVAYAFGANGRTDAFYDAFTLPDFLNYLLAGGTLSITFLPIYARYLAEKRKDEADRVFSIVMTVMGTLVISGVVLGELFAHQMVASYFDRLGPAEIEDCVRYTRILLPAQIFFVLGGVISATLYAQKSFTAPALAPLLYNGGIILVGWLARPFVGADGLAWGALVGAFSGPFLIPLLFALKLGLRFRPSFDVRHAAFREWLFLTIPLMLGVSLVTADDWIIRHFASGDVGATSRLNYAKRLVAVPIAVAGQAVGQASMPFFAQLFAEGRRQELADTLAKTVRGVLFVCILGGAWMVALNVPLTDLLLRRGHFSAANVPETATYLSIFAFAIPLWGAQGIYARAFYAARNTLWPMVSGTVVTLVSVPVYAVLYGQSGPSGLAWASNVGILLHTIVLLALLPRILPEHPAARTFAAAVKMLLAAFAGLAATYYAVKFVPALPAGHLADLVAVGAGSVVFGLVVLAAAKLLRVEELNVVLDKVLRRLRRRAA